MSPSPRGPRCAQRQAGESRHPPNHQAALSMDDIAGPGIKKLLSEHGPLSMGHRVVGCPQETVLGFGQG